MSVGLVTSFKIFLFWVFCEWNAIWLCDIRLRLSWNLTMPDQWHCAVVSIVVWHYFKADVKNWKKAQLTYIFFSLIPKYQWNISYVHNVIHKKMFEILSFTDGLHHSENLIVQTKSYLPCAIFNPCKLQGGGSKEANLKFFDNLSL